jgi:hypothetical protein
MALGPAGTTDNATLASSTMPIAARNFENLTPGSQYVWLGRKNAPLLAMLTMGMGLPHESVTAKSYKTLTDHPIITNFLISGYSAGAASITTTRTQFTISDTSTDITDPRKLVQVGDSLIVHPKQNDGTNVQTTADGTVAMMGEVIEVAEVNATYFTATRNIGSTATTGNVACASGHKLRAELLAPADDEDTRSREMLSHAMQTQDNYIQNMHRSFEVTKDVYAMMLAGGNEMDRQQRLAFDAFMKQVERTLLLGKLKLGVVDSAKYRTRGWGSFLGGDSATYGVYAATGDLLTGTGTNRTWKIGSSNNLTPENWMKVMAKVYHEGENNKVLVCGQGFLLQLILAFEGYWTLPIPSIGSGGFDIDLTLSGIRTPGGTCRVLVHPEMYGSYYNDAFVFDLDHMGVKVYNNGSYDEGEVHIWRGLNGTGLQENDATKIKLAWAAQLGAHMTYKDAHAYFFGMENENGTLGGPDFTVGTQDPSNT